jgi:hypothetical protein
MFQANCTVLHHLFRGFFLPTQTIFLSHSSPHFIPELIHNINYIIFKDNVYESNHK